MADIPCVGAVVFDEQDRLLLVKRANPPAQGTWSLPGGRLETGETAHQGVVREVLEETGLQVVVEREVGTVTRLAPSGDTYVIRDFVCRLRAPADPVAGDDAADACFFEVRDVFTLITSTGLIEVLQGWGLLPDRSGPPAGVSVAT